VLPIQHAPVQHAGGREQHQPVMQRLHIHWWCWERVESQLSTMMGLPSRVQIHYGSHPPPIKRFITVKMHRK
jgi:hypothetical protein